MLELFEKIYTANEKLTEDELHKLYIWFETNHFPSSYLPSTYLSLMRESNGGDFIYGEREYQFFSIDEVMEYYEAYMFSEFMPFAYPFAMDGCGNFFLFNLRAMDDCVYTASAGNMGWEKDECFKIANNFLECLQQDRLWDEYID